MRRAARPRPCLPQPPLRRRVRRRRPAAPPPRRLTERKPTMTQTSRYTVTTWWHSGHPRGDAVGDALRACLSEWEVVADVHVTRQPAATGDDAHNVTVHWDTTAPEWPDEYWPMHAADALGHAAERVNGVTDAVAVCHDQLELTAAVVDASPPPP